MSSKINRHSRLLDFGMREYFSAKGIQMITLNKVSVWSDCARHFRCGAFIFSSLHFLEGSYLLSKVRSVNFFTEHHGVTCCQRAKACTMVPPQALAWVFFFFLLICCVIVGKCLCWCVYEGGSVHLAMTSHMG